MKIFLSALENGSTEHIVNKVGQMKWNLCSFYYIRSKLPLFENILAHSEEMLIDSGAHSFQKGKKVDWDRYTKEYAEFIRSYDTSKILGYFEMDVDNIIGYDKVLQLRSMLMAATDKIIPVWHKNRGIEDFQSMCREYSGRIVAITGFANEDIRDEQYPMFLQYAHKHNCKLHCLGMTRRKILDAVPFDYVDSSSWRQQAVYGKLAGKRVKRSFSLGQRDQHMYLAYATGMLMQKEYHEKWRHINGD